MGAADRIAEVILRQGEIAGRGAQNNGAIWGGALQNLGQTVAALPTYVQNQRMREQEVAMRNQEMQMRDQQMQQLQRAQASQDAANKVVAGFPRRADGTYDVGGMIQQMSGLGVHPADMEHYGSTFEKLNQLSTAAVEAQRQHQARAADIILSGAQGQEITPEDVHVALATLKTLPGGLVTDEDEQAWTQAFAAGQDPRKFLESVSRAGKGPQKPDLMNVPQGDVVIDKNNPSKPVFTAPAKTEAPKVPNTRYEALYSANVKDPAHPTNDELAIVDAKMKEGEAPKDTSAEMDAAYQRIVAKQAQGLPITAQEAADKKAYETRKLLGPEASSAAANSRLAATQAATNSRLDKSESFAEAQAGRKELTDKVEQPYLDAKEKAATLRSVIEAAKNGNMAAGNVQSLLATLGLVTMEGVKRINTTELESVQGAGSLLERLKGEVGGIVSGKPLSPKIQQDLTQMATLLEQSARKKYEQGFKQITGRYGLKDEQILPSEVPTSAAPAGGVPTYQDYLKAKQGKP